MSNYNLRATRHIGDAQRTLERGNGLQCKLDKARNAPRFGFLPGLVSGALVVGGLWAASYFAFSSKPLDNKPAAIANADNKAADNSALISANVSAANTAPVTTFTHNPPKFVIQAYVGDEWKDATTVLAAEKYRIAVLKEHLGWPQHYTIDVENKETALAVKRIIIAAEENDAKNGRLLQDYLGKQSPGRVFYFGHEVVRILENLPRHHSDGSDLEILSVDVAEATKRVGTTGGLDVLVLTK